MDTLRAILALVPKKGLQLHQMDVKGAYLNGTLQETTRDYLYVTTGRM